jgi:hypothetical protein
VAVLIVTVGTSASELRSSNSELEINLTTHLSGTVEILLT